MQDALTILHKLRRPKMLMRAAQIGVAEYKRVAHLPRLLGYGRMPKQSESILKLIEIEIEKNLKVLRKAGESAYNLLRHIYVMIAIVGEARDLRASQPKPVS